MNRIIRTIAAAATLGLASSAAAAGIAVAADLLQAPTGAESHDAGAWTSAVSRSYVKQYSDVQCSTLPVVEHATAPYDLGTSPSGRWFFAVVTSQGGQHQYGPAELVGTRVPAASGATELIGCHGTPATGDGTLVAAVTGGGTLVAAATTTVDYATSDATDDPTDDATEGRGHPAASTSPSPSPSSAAVPNTVAAGIEGGQGGLMVLAVGGLGVAGLGLLGRRQRTRP